MVDVKVEIEEYTAFPTMIYKFHPDLANDLHFNMAAYIRAQKGTQTEDDIYKLSTFRPLATAVHKTMADIFKKLEFEYKKIEITGMWGNLLKVGVSHPPHTHSNNLWSGVYYVESAKGAAPIQFFDPRPQANQFQPKNNPNWNNSGMIQFNPDIGTGIIFPSWLQHWVPMTQFERISVSWNILLRGDYGKVGTFQNAHI